MVVGEQVVFTLTVRNDGTASATNVVVTDQIPPKLDGVTVTTTKGTAVFDPNTRLLTVTVGQLEPGRDGDGDDQGQGWIGSGRGTALHDRRTKASSPSAEGAPRTSNRVTVTVNGLPPAEIPEPGTWLMLGAGLAGFAGYAKVRAQARRRK